MKFGGNGSERLVDGVKHLECTERFGNNRTPHLIHIKSPRLTANALDAPFHIFLIHARTLTLLNRETVQF